MRRWRWIGHILRTSPSNILRTALAGHLKVKGGEASREKRGEEMWRKKETSWIGGAAVASAADRDGWRNLLAGLKSPHGPNEDK